MSELVNKYALTLKDIKRNQDSLVRFIRKNCPLKEERSLSSEQVIDFATKWYAQNQIYYEQNSISLEHITADIEKTNSGPTKKDLVVSYEEPENLPDLRLLLMQAYVNMLYCPQNSLFNLESGIKLPIVTEVPLILGANGLEVDLRTLNQTHRILESTSKIDRIVDDSGFERLSLQIHNNRKIRLDLIDGRPNLNTAYIEASKIAGHTHPLDDLTLNLIGAIGDGIHPNFLPSETDLLCMAHGYIKNPQYILAILDIQNQRFEERLSEVQISQLVDASLRTEVIGFKISSGNYFGEFPPKITLTPLIHS